MPSSSMSRSTSQAPHLLLALLAPNVVHHVLQAVDDIPIVRADVLQVLLQVKTRAHAPTISVPYSQIRVQRTQMHARQRTSGREHTNVSPNPSGTSRVPPQPPPWHTTHATHASGTPRMPLTPLAHHACHSRLWHTTHATRASGTPRMPRTP